MSATWTPPTPAQRRAADRAAARAKRLEQECACMAVALNLPAKTKSGREPSMLVALLPSPDALSVESGSGRTLATVSRRADEPYAAVLRRLHALLRRECRHRYEQLKAIEGVL